VAVVIIHVHKYEKKVTRNYLLQDTDWLHNA